MRVVLDTNVLVAGLLSPFGPCGQIVRMVSSGGLTLYYDARIFCEYHEVLLGPKFRFDREKTALLLKFTEARGCVVAPSPLPVPLPDADDEPFLEVALSGGAEYLITGNHAHLPVVARREALVVSPREFLEAYSARGRP